MIDLPGLCFCSAYLGAHMHEQAEGALAAGSRVEKVLTEPGDGHPIGALATVIGSLAAPPPLDQQAPFFYFVAWDDRPRVAVGVASPKIRAAQ